MALLEVHCLGPILSESLIPQVANGCVFSFDYDLFSAGCPFLSKRQTWMRLLSSLSIRATYISCVVELLRTVSTEHVHATPNVESVCAANSGHSFLSRKTQYV